MPSLFCEEGDAVKVRDSHKPVKPSASRFLTDKGLDRLATYRTLKNAPILHKKT
jgi:hypothetical protein